MRIPDAQRVGELGRGFADTMRILDRGRISIAAMALGLGYGALEKAVSYAKERHAFGRPIAEFQAIQFSLADAKTELDAAAAPHLPRRLARRSEARLTRRKRRWPSSSRARPRRAPATRAVQVHGGYGYVREFDVERHLRDAKLCEIGEGTSEVQRMVIAKHVLR